LLRDGAFLDRSTVMAGPDPAIQQKLTTSADCNVGIYDRLRDHRQRRTRLDGRIRPGHDGGEIWDCRRTWGGWAGASDCLLLPGSHLMVRGSLGSRLTMRAELFPAPGFGIRRDTGKSCKHLDAGNRRLL
jgi:hypothetical protein